MARAKFDPNIDRYGSLRACAAVHAAQAAMQGLDETISAWYSRRNPTPARAEGRQTDSAASDNLVPGAAVSTSAIRVL